MAIRHLLPQSYESQPWRNGLGVSRTIARGGEPDGRTDWVLSLTTIGSDCPFSDYRGYDRVFTPVAGKGVTLAIDSRAPVRLDVTDRPFGFSGDAHVECRLVDGPVEVVNAMVLRAWGVQTVTILHGRALHYPVTAPIVLLHAMHGPAEFTIADRAFTLDPGGTLRLDDEVGTNVAIAPGPATAIYAAAFRPNAERG